MKTWYLLYTKSRQEHVAKHNLEFQGYKPFLPMIFTPARKQGQHMVATPMFPRYLFINLCERNDNWGPVRSTVGIVCFVKFGHWPASVPDDLVEELGKYQNWAKTCPKELTLGRFRCGDKVRIAKGPFEGYEALIGAFSSKHRIMLLLQVAEKQLKMTIDESALEAI